MFRRVCNVNGKVWPDPNIERINPTTGEKYLTPVWQFDVTESRNKFVCETLATQVEAEMRLKRPEGVPDDAVWDSKFLLKCAKNSFRAMKDSWRDGVEAEAKARTEINQRNTRMFRRRDTKLEHIMSQIEEYAEVHNIPLAVAKDLLTQQHVSDEASGPEDEDEETPAAWKVRMAIECGIQDLSAANLKKLNFFEVLKCPWRSPQLSQISHVTQTMWAKSLTENELKNIKFRRVTTTHRKSLRIPKTSPWDFGINQEWLEEHGDLVSTWGTYGNPEGFEVPDSAEVGEVRARIDESADPRFAFEGGVNA
ncbi:hypothetical protein B0H16DRAFT_1306988 [Mycena metata]|uniref:Uncharacterized protein n=1 Tax=Mycena metata TaxID=1033252 RepID=A0AAD7JQV1_9AGAR|nr:hypothetical protein B0H16DRAFT_1306988 [Mycena metata]